MSEEALVGAPGLPVTKAEQSRGGAEAGYHIPPDRRGLPLKAHHVATWPRGRPRPEAGPRRRLRTAISGDRGSEKRLRERKNRCRLAEGGRPWEEPAPYANHSVTRGLGAGQSMQNQVLLWKREGAVPLSTSL